MLRNSYVKDIGILSLILGILFITFLGQRPFSAPDEGRYVEIPREMVATGDYLTPHLNGLKYFEKPPLGYWIQAGFIKMFGLSEFTMRLPLALLALLGCLTVYLCGRKLFNRDTGLWGGLILGTSFLYYILSRLITLDMLVSTCLTIGLLTFLCAMQCPPGKARRLWLYAFYTSCAGAFLSKGLIGIAIPGSIIGLWVIIQNYWKKLFPLYLPTGILLFLIIALPWPLLMHQKHPEFSYFFFIREHFERFLSTIHRRYQPWWFFFPVTFIGFWPWIAFLPGSIDHIRKELRSDNKSKFIFLIIWIIFIFVFYSWSKSKLIPYIIPIFPALSLLVGHYLNQQLVTLHRNFIVYGVSSLIFSTVLICLITWGNLELHPSLSSYVYIIIALLGVSAVTLIPIHNKYGSKKALQALVFFHILFLSILNLASPYINKISVKEMAHLVKTQMPVDTKLYTYHAYYQDLPVYMNKTIPIIEWEGELSAGAGWDKNQKVILKEDEFQSIWKNEPHACVITRQDFYDSLKNSKVPTWLIHQEGNHVLGCNFNLKTLQPTLNKKLR